jgi:hypothetical protein
LEPDLNPTGASISSPFTIPDGEIRSFSFYIRVENMVGDFAYSGLYTVDVVYNCYLDEFTLS